MHDPIYGFGCGIQGCAQHSTQATWWCTRHAQERLDALRTGIGEANWKAAAIPLPAKGIKGVMDCRLAACRFCPDRDAIADGLCRKHQALRNLARGRAGPSFVEEEWLDRQISLPGAGDCRIRNCRGRAESEPSLCPPHRLRWRVAGSPRDHALHTWLLRVSGNPNAGMVSLAGLPPLLEAEIRYGLWAHTQNAGPARWHPMWLRTLVKSCTNAGVTSLLQLDPEKPAWTPQPARVNRIVREMRMHVEAVDRTRADTRDLGYLDPNYWGYRFPGRRSAFDLTPITQRWLRDLSWDYPANVLDGPRRVCVNVIYHEGRKHRVTACILPAGGIDTRLISAKCCLACGYIHPSEAALSVDLCEHCGTRLDGATMEYPQALLNQPTVRASRWARISSDEEERSREGYAIDTHFRFAPGDSTLRADIVSEGHGAETLMEVAYAPQSELWRINTGWRRAKRKNGFAIDSEAGRWGKRDDGESEDDDADPGAERTDRTGVKPYVTDSRNLLLLRPRAGLVASEQSYTSLAYALQRGIQFVYQVEEQEVAIELIGQGDQQRLLLWEAAEGGTGVWERLLADKHALSEIAREALRVCHFDPVSGEPDADWSERCARACYDCLLSYSNQRAHRLLDRYAIRDYLLALSSSILEQRTAARTYDEQYRWLLERIDPHSSLERHVVELLYASKLRLPDLAQYRPVDDVAVQTDFYYERNGLPGICVFVDGPAHSEPLQAARDREVREALEDRGFRVVAISVGQPLDAQLAALGTVLETI